MSDVKKEAVGLDAFHDCLNSPLPPSLSFVDVAEVKTLAEGMALLLKNAPLASLTIPSTSSQVASACQHAAIVAGKLTEMLEMWLKEAKNAQGKIARAEDIAKAWGCLQDVKDAKVLALKFATGACTLSGFAYSLLPIFVHTYARVVNDAVPSNLDKDTFESVELASEAQCRVDALLRKRLNVESTWKEAKKAFDMYIPPTKDTRGILDAGESHRPVLPGAGAGMHVDCKEVATSRHATVDINGVSSPAAPVTLKMSSPTRYSEDSPSAAAESATSSHVLEVSNAPSHQSAVATAACAASMPLTIRTDAWNHAELLRILLLPDAPPSAFSAARALHASISLANEIANVLVAPDEEKKNCTRRVQAGYTQVKAAWGKRSGYNLKNATSDFRMHYSIAQHGLHLVQTVAYETGQKRAELFGTPA